MTIIKSFAQDDNALDERPDQRLEQKCVYRLAFAGLETTMNQDLLKPEERTLVEIIEAIGFGQIEAVVIRTGLPLSEPAPRIVQSFKLDSPPNRSPENREGPAALKQEFQQLFDKLSRIRDGIVDIEVRHG